MILIDAVVRNNSNIESTQSLDKIATGAVGRQERQGIRAWVEFLKCSSVKKFKVQVTMTKADEERVISKEQHPETLARTRILIVKNSIRRFPEN